MKRLIYIFFAIILSANAYGQNNSGSPYSMYGIGIMPENSGAFVGMGGVSAAMRNNTHVNYLNPASYTALDSNRFYAQLGATGERVHILSNEESGNYSVAQNDAVSFALRIAPLWYFSTGFIQRSNIGYDLYFVRPIVNTENRYFAQQISGEGGLNDFYMGIARKFGNFSIGLNASVTFGSIETVQVIEAGISNSYAVTSQKKTSVTGFLVVPGVQYQKTLKNNSSLTLGLSGNLNTFMNAKETYYAYTTPTQSSPLHDETITRGNVKFPFRIVAGASYAWKNKWNVAADYTYQRMSSYAEFGKKQEFNDYHKIAVGGSFTPDINGRYQWQRNSYQMGAYYVRSHIELYDIKVNTFGLTLGSLFSVRDLTFGIALDGGVRGSTKNGMLQEKFAKLRLNIVFKESWFMKRKIY